MKYAIERSNAISTWSHDPTNTVSTTSNNMTKSAVEISKLKQRPQTSNTFLGRGSVASLGPAGKGGSTTRLGQGRKVTEYEVEGEEMILDPLDEALLKFGINPASLPEPSQRTLLATAGMSNPSQASSSSLSWLKVPCKHSYLRQMLRVKLVELFTERGAIFRFENILAKHPGAKLNREFFSKQRGEENLGGMNQVESEDEDDNRAPPGSSFGVKVKKQTVASNRLLADTIMNTLGNRGKTLFPEEYPIRKEPQKREPINQNSENQPSQKFNKYSAVLPRDFQWTDSHESEYKRGLYAAKINNLHDPLSGSATFADCALSSFIYTYINTKTTEQQRGELLDK